MTRNMKKLKRELKRFRKWLAAHERYDDMSVETLSKMYHYLSWELDVISYIVITDKEEIIIDKFHPENVYKLSFDKIRYIAKFINNYYTESCHDSCRKQAKYDDYNGSIEIIKSRLERYEKSLTDFTPQFEHVFDEVDYDYLNKKFFKDITPFEYCIKLVKKMKLHTEKYFLDDYYASKGGASNAGNCFIHFQPYIFMKNGTFTR